MYTILLVEDDPMISEVYQRKFSESGYSVDIAMTGTDVLKKAQEKPYDLILLDLVLPGLDGMSVLKELRTSGKYDENLKVLIFSNLNDVDNQQLAVKLGASGFIPKSQYNPSELVEQVGRLLHEFEEQERNETRRASETFSEKSEVRSGQKIIFIEDEEIFIEMFANKLKNEGYEVVVASDGSEGWRVVQEGGVGLVITDMQLPGMRGDQIVENMRQNDKTKDIPVILFSASSTDEDMEKVHLLGISEYFIKTQVTPSELVESVRKVLDKK